MPDIKGTIEIDRPVEAVWEYVAEPKNSMQWESGVEEMELTTEGPVRVGSKGRRVETYMGRDEAVWEVTEWIPNKRAFIKFESNKFAGESEWNVEATDSGTRLSYRFGGSPKSPFFKLFFKLLTPLMKMMINRTARKNYVKLKAILESSA